MTPCPGNTTLFCSSQQLPRLGLGPLKGFFELTRHLSRALDLDAYVASELQRYKDTVRCGALSAEVPGHCQEQLTQTLIVRWLCEDTATEKPRHENCDSDTTRPIINSVRVP